MTIHWYIYWRETVFAEPLKKATVLLQHLLPQSSFISVSLASSGSGETCVHPVKLLTVVNTVLSKVANLPSPTKFLACTWFNVNAGGLALNLWHVVTIEYISLHCHLFPKPPTCRKQVKKCKTKSNGAESARGQWGVYPANVELSTHDTDSGGGRMGKIDM